MALQRFAGPYVSQDDPKAVKSEVDKWLKEIGYGK